MHHVERPRYLHTEPPVPPPNPQPGGEPVRPPPLPPGSPYPGKPQDDPPQGPPDQPLQPPPPIVAAKPRAARSLAGTRRSAGEHWILPLAMLVASAPAVWAAEELDPQDRPAAFRKLDTDGDGWISVEEAAAQPEVAENFQKADRDHDGRLSLDEFEAVAINRSDQPGKFRNPDRG